MTYIGELGSGNYVKMVHNGIEYGDMQLIAEAYDVLRTVRRTVRFPPTTASLPLVGCVLNLELRSMALS